MTDTERDDMRVSLRDFISEKFAERDKQLAHQAVEYGRRMDLTDKILDRIEHNNKEKLDVNLYRSEHRTLVDRLDFAMQRYDKTVGQVNELEKTLERLSNSLTWLVRLLISAAVLSSLGYVASHVLTK